jgi:CO dehydrogenase/acetyl-CoA synthase alpha subunit
MVGEVIPLCGTCALWGQGSCRLHQGRRGCSGCGGLGRIVFMQVRGGAVEVGEMLCPCVDEERK